MNMDTQTIGLLNEVAKNAEMGKHTAQDLAQITEDVRMKNELQRQVDTYEDLQNRARAMLAVGGEEPKDESTMAKMSAKMGVKMQTAMDKSNTNLAKMIIEMCIRDRRMCVPCARSVLAQALERIAAQFE